MSDPLPDGVTPFEPLPEGVTPFTPEDDVEAQKDSAIDAIFKAGLSAGSDEQAAVINIADKMKVPRSVVAERLPEFQRAAEHANFDPRTFRQESPELAAFLLERPAMGPVVRDDSANLTGLEYALTGRRRVMIHPDGQVTTEETLPAWAAYLRDTVHATELAYRQTLDLEAARLARSPGGQVTAQDGTILAEGQTYTVPEEEVLRLQPRAPTGYSPENTARMEELSTQVPQARDYGIGEIRSPWARKLAEVSTQILDFAPPILGGVASGAAGGAVGGPVGAFGAMFAFNYGLSAGPEYAGMKAQLEASGKTGDAGLEDEAVWLSTLGGVTNAAIMSGGLGAGKGLVKEFGAKLGIDFAKREVKRVVADETLGRILVRAARDRGLNFAQGLATLSAMSGVSTATAEKFRSDVEGDEAQYSRVGDAMVTTARDMAAAMLVMSAGSMPVRRYIEEIGNLKGLEKNAERIQKAAQLASQSKAAGQTPEATSELVGRLAAAGDASTFLVEKAEFDRLYQAKKVNPREVAAEFLGDGGRAYDQAGVTGDIAVPAQVFLTKMARTKDGLALTDVTRLPQDSRNPRQTREVAKRIGKKIVEQAEAAVKAGNPAPFDAIFEDFKGKAVGAGASELEAKTNAEVVARAFTWMAAQSNRDPMELYRTEVPLLVDQGKGAKTGLPSAERPATTTPEFKAWFGESKVVDEKGQPLVVYHGTNASFEVFQQQTGDVGYHAGAVDTANRIFTSKSDGIKSKPSPEEGRQILPLYMKIKNPLRVADLDTFTEYTIGPELQRLGLVTDGQAWAQSAQSEGTQKATLDWKAKFPEARTKGDLAKAGLSLDQQAAEISRRIAEVVRSRLEQLGFDGLVYENKIEGGGDSYVAFHPEQLKSAIGNRGTFDPASPNILEQRGIRPGKERGSINVRFDAEGKPVEATLHLSSPDRSTLPHETMHWFTEVMQRLAERTDAAESLKTDFQTLLRAMGYTSPRERSVAAKERRQLASIDKPTPAEATRLKELIGKEEKVSHMWEQFLLEGQAPTKELLPIFARFKTWLTRIYKNIEGVREQYRQNYGTDLELSEPVRDVFRRMVAGEQAVEEAFRTATSERPLVALTPDEQKEADALAAEARMQAEAAVQRLLVQESRAADKEFMQSERKRMQTEVEGSLQGDPVYRAIDGLRRKEAGQPQYLDREAVLKGYGGASVADALPEGTVGKGGWDSDAIAPLYNFASGAELVRALVAAEPKDSRIRREVGNRMRELYPTLLDRPAALVQAAGEQLHNAAFLREGIIRLRAMARELGMEVTVPSAKELADAAEVGVSGMTYSEMRPDRFDTAAKSAVSRMASEKDKKTILADYETYLLNRAMQRAAAAQRTQIETDVRAIHRLDSPEARARLGKAFEESASGLVQPFLTQHDKLLAAFEFAPSATMKDVQNRPAEAAALLAWRADRWAVGDMVVIPDSVLERLQRVTHWKDLTAGQIADLRTAVESIAAMAKNRTLYRVGEELIDKETVVIPELLKDLESVPGGIQPVGPGGEAVQVRGEKVKRVGRQLLNAISREERLYRQLGPAWTKYLWDPMSDSAYQFADLVRKSTEPVRKMLEEMPAAERERLHRRIQVDGYDYDGRTIIKALLDSANESNLSKMLKGNSDPRQMEYGVRPWEGRNTLDQILAHATQKDVDLAQRIIDGLESFWPLAEAMEKREHGVAPPKIQGKKLKFIGAGGVELEGPSGYVPVIYSRRFRIGQEQQEADVAGLLGGGVFNRGYDAATTPKGYLQARIETYARPLDMTLDALPRKFVMAAKDVAFRTNARQAYRLLMDTRIAGALHQKVGPEGYELLVEHLKDTVNDVMIPDSGANIVLRAFRRLKSETYHAIFGFNVAQTAQNLADTAGIHRVVPTSYFLKAGMDITRSIRGGAVEGLGHVQSAVIDQIVKESAEMRLRADGRRSSLGEQLRDVFDKSGLELKWQQFQDLSMIPFETTNAMTETSTYLGAKRHWLDTHPEATEKQAIRHAEEAVRTAFGGKRTIDLNAVQRSAILKHFTMFWGWSAAQLDMFLGSAHQARVHWSKEEKLRAIGAVASAFASAAAIQLSSDLFVGKGPKKDREDDQLDVGLVAEWAAFRSALALPEKLPIVGTMTRQFSGQQSRDVSVTPYFNVFNSVIRAVQGSKKALAKEELSTDDKINLFLSWLEVGGNYVGAPTSQTRQTVRYWQKRPEDAGFWQDVYGTGWGPRKKDGSAADLIFGENR